MGDEALVPISQHGFHHHATYHMNIVKIICWQAENVWLGYLQDYPDYWTQGDTLDDLKEHLKDLYLDLSSGLIPGARKVEELIIS